MMVVGRSDSEDLRLRSRPKPRVKEQNGHNKEQTDQGGTQGVDDKWLLKLLSAKPLVKVEVYILDPLGVNPASEYEECFFCQTWATGGYSHDESGDPESRVDGHQASPERSCGGLAAEQQQETEEPDDEL